MRAGAVFFHSFDVTVRFTNKRDGARRRARPAAPLVLVWFASQKGDGSASYRAPRARVRSFSLSLTLSLSLVAEAARDEVGERHLPVGGRVLLLLLRRGLRLGLRLRLRLLLRLRLRVRLLLRMQ